MKKKTAYMGLFLALALICSYIESFFSLGIPGIKLGLTNIVVIWLLYLIGTREAIFISILRIILAGFMFGNAFSIIYSLAGGILSFLTMYLMKKTNKFKCITVSIVGGIFHNIGQIIVAAIVVENSSLFYYLPVLLVSGVVFGVVIGMVGAVLVKRLSGFIQKQDIF